MSFHVLVLVKIDWVDCNFKHHLLYKPEVTFNAPKTTFPVNRLVIFFMKVSGFDDSILVDSFDVELCQKNSSVLVS